MSRRVPESEKSRPDTPMLREHPQAPKFLHGAGYSHHNVCMKYTYGIVVTFNSQLTLTDEVFAESPQQAELDAREKYPEALHVHVIVPPGSK